MRRPLPFPRQLASAAVAVTAAVTLAAPPALAAPTDQPPSTTADAPRWHTQGRWITDEAGRVVITVGVNQVAKLAPYTPASAGFGEEDAKFLAEQGFTSVRLGVIWKAVEPQPGQYDDAYLDQIKTTVETLHRHGIATLLDFHQDMFNEAFQGEGAPDWAVQKGAAPNVIKAGFPGNYMLNTATQNAFQAFTDNKPAPDGVGLADHYAHAWAHVAKHFRTTPGVMGFDLYNEPFPGNAWLGCLSLWGCPIQDAKVAALQQKSVDAIRAVDPNTTIYYEPMQFFNLGIPTSMKLSGTNLALSFHDYCMGQSIFKSYATCHDADARVFANAEKHSSERGVGLLLTEYGAITAPDVITAQTDLAMKNRVGYQWWAYTGGDPTTAGPGNEQAIVFDAMKAPAGDNVDWAKLKLMAVPSPHEIAGTPTSYSYDRSTKTFRLTYSTAKVSGGTFPAGSRSTVTIPQVAAPNGYHVRVTGASVVSAPNARTLELTSAPGSPQVSLTLTMR